MELSWADDLIEGMRRIKSPAEVELMRESTRVGAEMVEAFVEAAVPGATEADCVLAALNRGIPQGAFPLDIPVASGPNVDHFLWERMPSWDYRRPLEAGDMIHPDMYGTVNGYFYDMVRTTVAGRTVTEAQREVLEASVSVVEHIIDGMRPGVACGDLFDRGAAWLDEHGFEVPGFGQLRGRRDARPELPVVRAQPGAGVGEPVTGPGRSRTPRAEHGHRRGGRGRTARAPGPVRSSTTSSSRRTASRC